MAEYDYTLSPCAIDSLRQQIELSAIATPIDHVNLFGAALSVFFPSALSDGDKAILDGLIAAHDGTPLAGDYIEVTATSTTNSNNSSYGVINSMTSPHLIGGKYRIAFTGTFKTNVPLLSNPGVLISIYNDGAQEVDSEMAQNNSVSGAPFNMSTAATLQVGRNKVVDIRWKTNGQGNTITCLNRVLTITRIGD